MQLDCCVSQQPRGRHQKVARAFKIRIIAAASSAVPTEGRCKEQTDYPRKAMAHRPEMVDDIWEMWVSVSKAVLAHADQFV